MTRYTTAIDPLIRAATRTGIRLTELLTELEWAAITTALEASHGSKTYAARLLGMKRTTLIEKLRRHEIAGKEKS